MEKAKSLREIAWRHPSAGLLAEGPEWLRGQNDVSPIRGNLLYPRQRSLCFAKFPRGSRHPIWGKMNTPTLLNVPPDKAPFHFTPTSNCRLSVDSTAGAEIWVFPLDRFADAKSD